MGRPRILWLSKGLDQGGAESLLLDLATRPEFADFDIEVASVSTRHLGMRAEFEGDGIVVHDLGAEGALDFAWIGALRRLHQTRGYRLIHAHSPLPAAAARLTIGRHGAVPVVTTEHNLRSAYRLETRLLNRMTGRLDAASFGVSDAVSGDHSTSRRRVERLYHGRAAASGADPAPDLALDPLRFNIVMIANLRPEKSVETLLKAMSIARLSAPQLALTIVGDGVERSRLEAIASSLELDAHVRFLGQSPNARELLPAFQVLVLSSTEEGLPVVVMEALQAGVPVVSTRVGGVPELVVDGESGLLVPAGDADQLAAALVRVATEEGLRDALAAGAAEAAHRVDVAPAARRYAAVYRDLLGLPSAEQG